MDQHIAVELDVLMSHGEAGAAQTYLVKGHHCHLSVGVANENSDSRTHSGWISAGEAHAVSSPNVVDFVLGISDGGQVEHQLVVAAPFKLDAQDSVVFL